MAVSRGQKARVLLAWVVSAALVSCGQAVDGNNGLYAGVADGASGASADGVVAAADGDSEDGDGATAGGGAASDVLGGRGPVDGAGRADGGADASADGLSNGEDVPDGGPPPAAADGGGRVSADSAATDAAAGDAAAADTLLTDAVLADTIVADGTPADAAQDSAADAKADASQDVKADTADGKADVAPAAEAGPCKKEGAESCGKPLGVDPQSLYICKSGKWKWHQTCQQVCEGMPDGVPDRCTDDLDVPTSLVKTLDVTPYVEQSCTATTHPDWPYAAKKCTYTLGGKTATVVTATPSAEKVAAWIVDSAVFIPALWSLRYIDPPAYKQGLQKIAVAVLGQSSRIFPIEGGVLENMSGTAWVNYPFYHGVTDGCSTGCYCRINSLKREQWCAYKAFVSSQTEAECMAKVGYSGLTKGWGDQCLQNHIDAWKSTVNQHFRAKARYVHKAVAAQCATAVSCSPAKILNLLDQEL